MTLQNLISAGAALAGVVFLIVLAGRAARLARLGRATAGGRLRLEESLALDPKQRLTIVSCDGRSLLLLTGAQDCVIGWLPERAP